MAVDPRYASNAARLTNVGHLEREIGELTRRFDRDDLVATLTERKLGAGPVYSAADLINDPAFAQSGMMANLRHRECGERATPTLPVQFSQLDPLYNPAPLMGEHTDQILRDLLDMSESEIAGLCREEVLI